MTQEEPTLTYYDGATDSTSPRIISIDVVNDIVWVAAAHSDSGACFAIRDNVNTGVTYAHISGGCNGNNANATGAFGLSW